MKKARVRRVMMQVFIAYAVRSQSRPLRDSTMERRMNRRGIMEDESINKQHQARVYKIGDIQTHNAQQVTTEILHSLHSRIRGIVECQEHPKLTTIEEVHAKSQPLRFVSQMKS